MTEPTGQPGKPIVQPNRWTIGVLVITVVILFVLLLSWLWFGMSLVTLGKSALTVVATAIVAMFVGALFTRTT